MDTNELNEALTPAKRPRETGDLCWQVKPVDDPGREWEDLCAGDFATQLDADKWLKTAAKPGEMYRLIRVYRVVTPKFETKTTVAW